MALSLFDNLTPAKSIKVARIGSFSVVFPPKVVVYMSKSVGNWSVSSSSFNPHFVDNGSKDKILRHIANGPYKRNNFFASAHVKPGLLHVIATDRSKRCAVFQPSGKLPLMPSPSLRPMRPDEYHAVADLICTSTNAWYQKNRGFEIFSAGPKSCRLFPEVYETLDPGCCVIAEDPASGRLMGSCFYHPRPTHVSLGIMNVHPDFFGRGVASQLLRFITDLADRAAMPMRLVSSAMNLDSFSLYSRAGFVPRAVYADMQIAVPASGWTHDAPGADEVSPADESDIAGIVRLEKRIAGIEREKDYRFFIENKNGIWNPLALADGGGEVQGFLCSVWHPASNMLGPGVMESDEAAIALICAQLRHHAGRAPVFLIPLDRPKLVQQMYDWGAKNLELHFGQVRGDSPPTTGVVMPTFMPETA